MPALPLNRTNAWESWRAGRVSAINVDNIGVDSAGTTPILSALAVKHGFNAIRFWLNWGWTGSAEYTLLSEDWRRIGWEGWDSQAYTERTKNTSKPIRISEVAVQVKAVLKKCEALGLGVILTGDFFGAPDENRLWVDGAGTTAAGLQGDLGLFWQKTIAYFGSYPSLIGLDLLNEPKPTKGLTLAEARSTTRYDSWPRLAQYLVKVIRQVDTSSIAGSSLPRIPIIIQGSLEDGKGLNLFLNPANPTDNSFLIRDYTYGSGNAAYTSRTDDRIVYSSHAYAPGDIASQGVFDFTCLALGSSYPLASASSTPVLQRDWTNPDGTGVAVVRNFGTDQGWDAVFSAERTMVNSLKVPVFLGEFGSVQPVLDWVHPAQTGRASRDQRVTTLKPLTSATVAATLEAERQVTSVTYDATAQTYTFGLDNIKDSTFQPVHWLDASAVKAWYGHDVDGEGYPVKVDKVTRVPPGEWPPQWFTSSAGLVATFYWVDAATGKLLMTPVFQSVSVKVVGGVKSITIPASAIGAASLPNKPLGTAVNGVYPVVGVFQFGSSLTSGEIDASRALMARDMLRMCQRNKMSWAYFAADNDSVGFIGWRPSPLVMGYVARAANGDKL